MELAALGIAAIILAFLIQRLDVRLLAISGVPLIGMSNVLTVFATDVFTFSLIRAIAGVGSGFTIVSAGVVASSNTNYSRLPPITVAYFPDLFFFVLIFTILFLTLPRIAELIPKAGTFIKLAGIAFSGIPLLLFLQRGSRQARTQFSFSAKSLEIVAFAVLSVCFLCQLCDAVLCVFNLPIASRASRLFRCRCWLSPFSGNNFSVGSTITSQLLEYSFREDEFISCTRLYQRSSWTHNVL